MNSAVPDSEPLDPRALEQQGWIAAAVRAGEVFFGEHMAEDGVAVVAGGVLPKEAVLAALAVGEPWEEFHLSDQCLVQPAHDVQILVYRARAKRAAQPWYEALITSVYLADEDRRWSLVCHQQTPVPLTDDA